MASGPIAYWTYGIGALFLLLNAMNMYIGCSKALSSWGWGTYTCDTFENAMMFNMAVLNMAALVMLMMAATVVDCNVFMAKIIAVVSIPNPILTTVHWSSVKINDHTGPNSIWYVLGFYVVTFAIAAVMGLKGQVPAEPKPVTFGALNKWAFGVGGILFVLNAGNLSLSCDQAMENWGWGKYTCNTLEAGFLVNQSIIGMAMMMLLIMVATTTANKTDLIKISAPMLLGFLTQLIYFEPLKINGHSTPVSVYVVQGTVFASFFIAMMMHNSASARQVEPAGYAPLVSA